MDKQLIDDVRERFEQAFGPCRLTDEEIQTFIESMIVHAMLPFNREKLSKEKRLSLLTFP